MVTYGLLQEVSNKLPYGDKGARVKTCIQSYFDTKNFALNVSNYVKIY